MVTNTNTKIETTLTQPPHAFQTIMNFKSSVAKLLNRLAEKRVASGTAWTMITKIRVENVNAPYERLTSIDLSTEGKTMNIEAETKIFRGGVFENRKIIQQSSTTAPSGISEGWNQVLSRFKNHIQTIDVSSLDMPLSILTVSSEIRFLPSETACLIVLQKNPPIIFLNELEEKRFDYRIMVVSEGKVNVLIFKL